MVVRFVQKVNNSNVMLIEDETGREKIAIKRGVVWVGLICCIETTWVDSMYRLDRIVDMGERVSMDMPMISYPMRAYRMLVTKGPFWDNKSSENVGLKIIITELARLRDKERIIIDCLIVMGPLLSVDNQLVSSCGLENSYEM